MILLHFHIGIAVARPTKPSHRVLYKSHEQNIGLVLIPQCGSAWQVGSTGATGALESSGGPPHGYPAHTNGGGMLFRSQRTWAVHWCIVGSHEIARFTRKSQFTPYGHMM